MDEHDFDTLRSSLAQALYWPILKGLPATMESARASVVALRCARGAVLRMLGCRQLEIALALGVSVPTVKKDAARVRKLMLSGAFGDARMQPLQPVPVGPDDRVVAPISLQKIVLL